MLFAAYQLLPDLTGDNFIRDYIILVNNFVKCMPSKIEIMITLINILICLINAILFVFYNLSLILYYFKLFLVFFILIASYIIILYFLIKKYDKLDWLFHFIRLVILLPISILCNMYNCTYLLFIIIPFIISGLSMYKNILKNKNVNIILFLIQFIYIFILMIFVKLFGFYIYECIFNYFESEYRNLFLLENMSKKDNSEKSFIFVAASTQVIYTQYYIPTLNKDLMNFSRLSLYSQIESLIPLANKLKTSAYFFNETRNFVMLKFLFNSTGCNAVVAKSYPFLSERGFFSFRHNKIEYTGPSLDALATSIDFKVQILINFYVQVKFGMVDSTISRGVVADVRDFSPDNIILHILKEKYPEIWFEYLNNNTCGRLPKDVTVWEYLCALNNGNGDYNKIKQAFISMKGYNSEKSPILGRIDPSVWTTPDTTSQSLSRTINPGSSNLSLKRSFEEIETDQTQPSKQPKLLASFDPTGTKKGKGREF